MYGEKSGVKESSEKLNIWKCGEAGGERNAVRRTIWGLQWMRPGNSL